MNAKETLEVYKTEIDNELKRYFQEQKSRAESTSIISKDMLEEIEIIALRGGKRIRPCFMIMGYLATGGKDQKSILKASITAELLHLSFILQDDIMDESAERHSGPSLHKVYYRWGKKNPSRYGESMASCGVDYLFALSYECLAKTNFQDHRKIIAIQKLSQITFNTTTGQMLDIELQEEGQDACTEEDIIDMHILKTAKYSFEGPLHVGAILAGATEEELFRLSEYAIPLGQAFQIRDDILGMFGSREKIGKPIDSDLKEGKCTLLFKKALESLPQEKMKWLRSRIGKKEVSEEEVQKVRELIIESGSLEYSQHLAEKLVARSREKLKLCKITPEAFAFFDGIAQHMVKREF